MARVSVVGSYTGSQRSYTNPKERAESKSIIQPEFKHGRSEVAGSPREEADAKQNPKQSQGHRKINRRTQAWERG